MEAGDGVVVGEGVVDGHVFKEGFHMFVEEGLDGGVVEGGVDEEGADVGFYYVWEAFWGVFDTDPVVDFAVCFGCCELDFGNVLHDLVLELGVVTAEVAVETELYAESAEELVGYHGHLVLGEPLWILVWVIVEQVRYASCIK